MLFMNEIFDIYRQPNWFSLNLSELITSGDFWLLHVLHFLPIFCAGVDKIFGEFSFV